MAKIDIPVKLYRIPLTPAEAMAWMRSRGRSPAKAEDALFALGVAGEDMRPLGAMVVRRYDRADFGGETKTVAEASEALVISPASFVGLLQEGDEIARRLGCTATIIRLASDYGTPEELSYLAERGWTMVAEEPDGIRVWRKPGYPETTA
jgi:hypothetical protein